MCAHLCLDTGGLTLHARTHDDGDRTAYGRSKAASGANTATATATATANAGGEPVPAAADAVRAAGRTVVFVGPMEHHSNILVWREADCDVVTIKATEHGTVDLADLADSLAAHAHYGRRVGSFAAASNVTGITEAVNDVTVLLHRHDALACWDYATAAPHG